MIRTLGRQATAVVALTGFVVARALDLLFFEWQRRSHPGSSLTGELTAWDGGWYHRIAGSGYPDVVLRHTHSGHVARSAYAFFPAYPLLVRWLADVTRLGFGPTAVLLNLVLGAGAAIGVAAVLRPWLGESAAATASVFWSFLPMAPVLMMAYTEALFCLELTVFFLLLQRRRYLALAVLLPLVGLTRGVLFPLAVVLAVHLLVRRRETAPGDSRLRAGAAPTGLIVLTGACTALWPAYVGWRAGRWNAYLKVQDAWVKDGAVHPSWWHAAGYLASTHGKALTAALILTAAGALLFSLLALLSRFSPLSPELKAFGLAYLLFLFALTPIWSSFFRYLLPVFTLPAVAALAARSIWLRIGVVAVLAGSQYWWIEFFVAGFPAAHATP